MVMHVERKHWWTQLPFSWGVEAVLAIVLVTGTAAAATQVRGRDATIADQVAAIGQQAATIGRQAAAIQQSEAQMRTMGRLAALDDALIEAYDVREIARGEGERALAAEDYQGWEGTLVRVRATQSRIDQLLAERQVMFYTPPT